MGEFLPAENCMVDLLPSQEGFFAWAGFRFLASERKRVDSETISAAAAATHNGGSLATIVIATVVSKATSQACTLPSPFQRV